MSRTTHLQRNKTHEICGPSDLGSCLCSKCYLSGPANNRQSPTERADRAIRSGTGKLPIDDPKRVHMVEIARPEVPSEVAPHIARLWQFRCYMPPGYDVIQFNGRGQVTKDGCYVEGGMSSSWGSPNAEATHRLLTVSLQKRDNRLDVFYSSGTSTGVSSWAHLIQLDLITV